jgi:ATP-binding cassette subfamily B multidrug efflux pump
MKALTSINKYFIKYKWRLLLGILFIFLTNYFAVLAPQIIRKAIDEVISKGSYLQSIQNEAIYLSEKNDFMYEIALLFLAVLVAALLRGFFLFCMRQTLIVMSRKIEYDQKNELYDHFQSLDTDFYKKNNTGDLLTRITEDVSKVRMYTGPGIMYTINLLAMSVLVLYHMIQVSPFLTLCSMFPLPIMLVIISIINKNIEKKSELIQKQLSELNITAQETYSGIRVIKAFVQENNFINRFKKDCDEYQKKSLDLVKFEAIYFPIIFVLVGLSTVMTILVGGTQVIEGTITIGVIAEFIIYINMVTWPFASVGWVSALIQRAAVSQQRIDELLNSQPKILSGNFEKNISGDIEFRNVSYTYPNTGIEALKNISFQLKKGERMAIIGKTGSGKTTVGALLNRLLDVNSGVILIDNRNIKTYSTSSLRKQLGYVPQDVFLFSDSILNNIKFGLDNMNEEKVKEAVEYASFSNEVEQMPNKYETLIGERGITLSGGQKQRLSIARAIIKNPPIILFDDCLSAVDANTESIILNNLNKYITGRTTIIITHRIFSLLEFDKIIVIDDGRIAEQGTHKELLEIKGLYSNIYELQSKEEES